MKSKTVLLTAALLVASLLAGQAAWAKRAIWKCVLTDNGYVCNIVGYEN